MPPALDRFLKAPPGSPRCWAPVWVWGMLALWTVSVAAGWATLTRYSTGAGEASAAPRALGDVLADAGRDGRARLLMFVHPRCPCSVASVRELARVMARTPSASATIHFYRPIVEDDSWAAGPLLDAAAAIPGVAVAVDPGGTLAERFGSKTSGEVFVYDRAGRLRFHGGITAARGHEGDNRGKSAAIAALRGESAQRRCSPVFGCTIRSEPPSREE